MVLAGSRYFSQWLNLSTPEVSTADMYSEGNEVDRIVFLLLILASIMVLVQRRLNWSELLKNNGWIWPYCIFCAFSILWSDEPFVTFKRWIKLIGVISMALVILTETHPYEALGVILRRIAYLLLPLSMLFIIYYPDLGRCYGADGTVMYTGVTFQKNKLGMLCLICGIYFCWNLIFNSREGNKSGKLLHFIYFIFLLIIGRLLYVSQSATSQVCLAVAICIFLISRVPAFIQKPNRNITTGIVLLSFYVILEFFFEIKETVIIMFGRTPDLTSRVPVWEKLLTHVQNPLFGFGYQNFWTGERMVQVWDQVGATIVTSHNGYLDTYLDLGIVGLSLALISIIAGAGKAAKHLNREYAYAILRLSIIIVFAIYNWTETAFIPLNNVFLLFWVSILEVPDAINDQKQQ
ncbi:MAG: O-antigen ligase family protein [Syntrophaceae bacterium]